VVALLVGTSIVAGQLLAAGAEPRKGNGLPVFATGTVPAAEYIVSTMDGERYAQVAVDPTLARPAHDFNGEIGQAAYAGSRPLFSWLAWAASGGGRSGAVAWAMVVLSVLSAGLLVLAVAAHGVRRGGNALWAWLVVLLPGTIAVLESPGEGDLLATALVLTGLLLWLDGERAELAIGVFALAALTRETTLLVPAALLLHAVLRRQRIRLGLLLPIGTYATWVVILRLRVGAWPTADGGPNLGLPFSAVREALRAWQVWEVLTLLLLGALVAAAWGRLAEPVKLIVACYLALFTVFGVHVMAFWWAFGRVLLPAYALCVASLLPSSGKEWASRRPKASPARISP
jgi:hypothetical protein